MSASFIIPFDNQPGVSTNLRTANYTVPSGKYARFIPVAFTGNTFFDSSDNNTETNIGIRLNNSYIPSKSFSVTAQISVSSALLRTNWFLIPDCAVLNVTIGAASTQGGANARLDYEILGGSTGINISTAATATANVNVISSFPSLPKNRRLIMTSLSSATASRIDSWFFSCQMDVDSFWLRSGDVINAGGSGRFIIEEFNSIT
jgi:hypothetical protein